MQDKTLIIAYGNRDREDDGDGARSTQRSQEDRQDQRGERQHHVGYPRQQGVDDTIRRARES